MAVFIIIMALLATVLGQHGTQVPGCGESGRWTCMNHHREPVSMSNQARHNPMQLEVITLMPGPGTGGVPCTFFR
ncbi:MAG TPA: hypothetical protein PLR71_13025 [Deltaproteobacteria bacterium]|nr:hypothetical protein [Deltaproteobacteria bacterium]